MFGHFKREWRELKQGQPGRRFRERCERSRRARINESLARRLWVPVVGGLLVVAGLVFCILPGPGLPLVAIGGGLLAQYSMGVACALDWLELKLRYVFSRTIAWWRHASLGAKNAVIAFAALAIAGVGYGAYHLVLRH